MQIAGVADAATGNDVYRKNRAASIAFYTIAGNVGRNILFRSLLGFVLQQKSLDGLEGVFLTGLNAVAQQGNRYLTRQGLLVWGVTPLGKTRDGGAARTIYFDIVAGHFLFLDTAKLASLSAAFHQGVDKSGILGHGLGALLGEHDNRSLNIHPRSGASIDMGAGSSIGTQVAGLKNQVQGQVTGAAKQAATDVATGFLDAAFGQGTTHTLETYGSLAIGSATTGATEGGLVGSAIPGIGSSIGAVIGAIVGFISGVITASEQLAGEQAVAELNALDAQGQQVMQDFQASAKLLTDMVNSLSAPPTTPVADPTPASSTPESTTSQTAGTTTEGTPAPATGGDSTQGGSTQGSGTQGSGTQGSGTQGGGGTDGSGPAPTPDPPAPDPPGSGSPSGDVKDDGDNDGESAHHGLGGSFSMSWGNDAEGDVDTSEKTVHATDGDLGDSLGAQPNHPNVNVGGVFRGLVAKDGQAALKVGLTKTLSGGVRITALK